MATVREDRRLGTIPTQREVAGTEPATPAPSGTPAATAEAPTAAPAGTVSAGTATEAAGAAPAAVRTAAPATPASSTTAPSIPLVPSQAPAPAVESLATGVEAPAVGAPSAPALDTPSTTEPAATDAPGATAPARRPRRVRTALVVGAVSLVLGALVAGIVVKVQMDARAAELARAQARVATESAARAVDERFLADRALAVEAASSASFRAAAVAQATAVTQAAQATLAATPQAGDGPRAALQSAIDTLGAAAASTGSGTSVATLRTTAAGVAAPQQAAVDAQAAWQAAEDARIAAERAAAEAAAAAEAQAAARRSAAARPAARAPRQAAAPRSSGGSAPAAAAPAAESAGGWAGGVESFGVGGLGEAINAHRAANGLGALSVSGSSSLANHAADMASQGRIWHSGRDHIVGYVQPVSASAMINAYVNSASHNAWLLSDTSHVSIGAVTINGRLYTAMSFS